MNRLGKILFVVMLVMMLALGAISPVIGSDLTPQPPLHAVEGGQEAPTCKYGGARIPSYVTILVMVHTAPCGWSVEFETKGRWEIIPDAPVLVLKSYHHKMCKLNKYGFIKVRPGCRIVVKADPAQVENGTIWRFTLVRVVAMP